MCFSFRLSENCFRLHPPESCFKLQAPENCFKLQPSESCFKLHAPENCFKLQPPEGCFKLQPPEGCFKLQPAAASRQQTRTPAGGVGSLQGGVEQRGLHVLQLEPDGRPLQRVGGLPPSARVRPDPGLHVRPRCHPLCGCGGFVVR